MSTIGADGAAVTGFFPLAVCAAAARDDDVGLRVAGTTLAVNECKFIGTLISFEIALKYLGRLFLCSENPFSGFRPPSFNFVTGEQSLTQHLQKY